MSPVARTSFALGSSFQHPGWKTAREIWGTEPEVIKRDLGKWASCEEDLSSALKRILFLSWSDFWKSPYKKFLSCRLSIVTWLQEMFWLVKERNVRWQILEWQGTYIKKTFTTKRVAWVQLSSPFIFKSCRFLSQNCVSSVVRGSDCYFEISSILSGVEKVAEKVKTIKTSA